MSRTRIKKITAPTDHIDLRRLTDCQCPRLRQETLDKLILNEIKDMDYNILIFKLDEWHNQGHYIDKNNRPVLSNGGAL